MVFDFEQDDGLPQVDPSRLELGPLLGRGASAKVYQAKYMGESVAAKLFSEAGQAPGLDLSVLRREVRLIARLRHGSIISLRGMCLDPRSKDARGTPLGVCLVTQLAKHGSIHSVLNNPALKMLFRPWKQRLLFLADAASGMYYLHSQGPPVLHRDIKPGNVLVTEQLHALIADFGISCPLSEGAASGEGTVNYMAPELFDGEEPSCATDVFAFGMLAWFVGTAADSPGPCCEPWAGKSNMQIQDMLANELRPKWPQEMEVDMSLQRFIQVGTA
jgi:serine/threonine protein kinase